MRKKMLFLPNPNAGHADLRGVLMDMLQIFTQGGYDVTVHPTQGPKDLTKTIAACGSDYDCVVCAGGDGTLNEAVSGLMQLENRPMLGYIPGGTVNDVASNLGLSHDPIKAARDVIHGTPFSMDVGAFGDDRWFAYVAGFGAFTDVAYQTPQQDKRILGRLAYLLNGIKSLSEIRPIPVEMTVNGQTIRDEVLLGLVCSTTSVGGFKAGPDLGIQLNDGLSEVVLVKNITSIEELNALAGCLVRREFDPDFFHTFRTDQVAFRFETPVAWTLDGEFGGETEVVSLRNCSRAIEILVP